MASDMLQIVNLGRPMKYCALRMLKFSALSAGIVLANVCYGMTDVTPTDNRDNERARFMQQQVAQGIPIGRAVKSLISHYPQQASDVVEVSLELYPDKYREILHSAISAQPSATEEIVQLAIEKNVASCGRIVELAIKAEPTYADFVVGIAAKSTPEELDEIVRIAVLTEPDSADTIVQTLSQQHPTKVLDIIKSALSAVPLVGEYVVSAMMAIFPDQTEDVVHTAVSASAASQDQVLKILQLAQKSGLSHERVMAIGNEAGLSSTQLAQLSPN